jgi:hypothetical protein
LVHESSSRPFTVLSVASATQGWVAEGVYFVSNVDAKTGTETRLAKPNARQEIKNEKSAQEVDQAIVAAGVGFEPTVASQRTDSLATHLLRGQEVVSHSRCPHSLRGVI